MFRLLKLLTYLRKINLTSEETLALIRRLETDSCRPEDYEVLIRVVRAHTKLSADDLDAFEALNGSSPTSRTPSQGPGAKKAGSRRLRAWGRGSEPKSGMGSLPSAPPDSKRGVNRKHESGEAP